jgi:hypothetical protein
MRSGLIISLLVYLLFSGCSLWPRKDIHEDPRTKAEDQFDPLGFPQDREIVTETEPPGEKRGEAEFEYEDRTGWEEQPGGDSLFLTKVYRVQFFATKYPDEATKVADMVSEQLSQKTYIEYKAPYYWVKVGDCLTKEESDALLDKIKKLGYRESWVVEDEIEQ